jgi:formylglycine-generating enzyme required for sulfatase activity
MLGKIFISYRRDDVAGDARGICEQLAAKFGEANVFMDIDKLRPGERFDLKLAEALNDCDILLAVIGPRWAQLMKERMANGEFDYVRQEIGEALRRGIVVIPVRVGHDGQMPSLPNPKDLTEDIRDLVRHQKHDVAHEHFGRDLAALMQALIDLRHGPRPKRSPWLRPVATSATILVVVVAGVWVTAFFFGGLRSISVDMFSPTRSSVPLTNAEEQALRTRDSFKECDACPEMVVVPAGSFIMGSPREDEGRKPSEIPQHRVTIPRPFAVGRFELTFAEWEACVVDGACRKRPRDMLGVFDDSKRGWISDKQPAIPIAWDEITNEYLPWLSRKTGKTYRLPTEAEWEYAARARTTTPFWWGLSISAEHANYDGSAIYGEGRKGNVRLRPLPVDSFAANPWGLYNVHGNVSEWVMDCWNASYDGAPLDGSAWLSGDCRQRVLRGGSWSSNPQDLRSAARHSGLSGWATAGTGFRVARTLGR